MWVDNNTTKFLKCNILSLETILSAYIHTYIHTHTHREAPAHSKFSMTPTCWTNWGESVRLDVLPVMLPAGLGGWPVTECIAHITGHTTTTTMSSTTTASTEHYWELIPIKHCCLTRSNTFTAIMSLESEWKCKITNLSAFLPSLHWHVKGFSSQCIALKVDVL